MDTTVSRVFQVFVCVVCTIAAAPAVSAGVYAAGLFWGLVAWIVCSLAPGRGIE